MSSPAVRLVHGGQRQQFRLLTLQPQFGRTRCVQGLPVCLCIPTFSLSRAPCQSVPLIVREHCSGLCARPMHD